MSGERGRDSVAPPAGGIPHVAIAALGLVTISVYGSTFYAFGVLLEPILDETGWSEPLVTGAFSAASLSGALAAGFVGRLVDAQGARRVMLVGGIAGCLALVAAARAPNVLLFAATYAAGGGLLSGVGFYHVTQASAARVAPRDPRRAIMLLTLYGAFAGPIYLPVTGFLVEATEWRTTLLALAISAAVGLLLAAAALDGQPSTSGRRGPTPSVWSSLADRRARALMISALVGSLGLSTLMVYQVPLMVAAGLPLATAASIAGLRGFAQFGGRVVVMGMIRRISPRRMLAATYLVGALAAVLLSVSGTVPLALLYIVVAGVGIGVWSPMEAIYASEVFPAERVATFLGTQRMIVGIGGAIGPVTAAVIAETSGSRGPTIVLMAVAAVAAAAILAAGERGQQISERASAEEAPPASAPGLERSARE